jgi:flagellar basal-body rod protein FlgC
MSLGSSMQISASGLTAERLRLDVISNNLANVNTTRGVDGQPYRRQIVTFAARQATGSFASALSTARGTGGSAPSAGAGVEVVSVAPDMSRDFKVVYDPGHPDADAKGMVKLPNVEPILEMVDMISATRAYEGGVTAITAAKQMEQQAMNIGKG